MDVLGYLPSCHPYARPNYSQHLSQLSSAFPPDSVRDIFRGLGLCVKIRFKSFQSTYALSPGSHNSLVAVIDETEKHPL